MNFRNNFVKKNLDILFISLFKYLCLSVFVSKSNLRYVKKG